ncbi:hypothetical protein FACS189440_10080 [Bacteroidia bacterium]|nr:hypothetical protein FACS189440_10080 [Bacteroidia bacterium]
MIFLVLTLIVLGAASAKAQVLISPGTAAPATGCDPSAVLELRSTDSGLLLPQVKLDTFDNTSLLTTPVAGMLVCNLTGSLRHGVYYWNGAAWTLYIGF